MFSKPNNATSSSKFTAPFKSHIKQTLQQQQQLADKSKHSFAKHGSILILSKTNTFRTLIAEAFIRGAIERRMDLIVTENTPKKEEKEETVKEGKEDEDGFGEESQTLMKNEKKVNSGTLEIDAEMMYTDPEGFDQKVKEFHEQHQQAAAAAAAEGKSFRKRRRHQQDVDGDEGSPPLLAAHPNLRNVVSAGRLQVVTSATNYNKGNSDDDHNHNQLPPVVKKLLLEEFSDKVPRKLIEGDEQQLWRKGISSIAHSVNSFDVIVSIVDGERLIGNDDHVSSSSTSDEDDDDESSTINASSDNSSSSSSIYSEHLDADPFTRIPGLEHLLQSNNNIAKATGQLQTNCTPSHWTPGIDGSYARNKFVVYTPRNPKVAADDSAIRLQDDYEGEPQFNEPKSLNVNSSVKKVRWFLPSMESLAKQRSFETDEEYERRVFKVMMKIDKLVDELCCVVVQ